MVLLFGVPGMAVGPLCNACCCCFGDAKVGDVRLLTIEFVGDIQFVIELLVVVLVMEVTMVWLSETDDGVEFEFEFELEFEFGNDVRILFAEDTAFDTGA